METSDLLEDCHSMREGQKFAGMRSGVLCVMTSGAPLMHKLCADSWDITVNLAVSRIQAIPIYFTGWCNYVIYDLHIWVQTEKNCDSHTRTKLQLILPVARIRILTSYRWILLAQLLIKHSQKGGGGAGYHTVYQNTHCSSYLGCSYHCLLKLETYSGAIFFIYLFAHCLLVKLQLR